MRDILNPEIVNKEILNILNKIRIIARRHNLKVYLVGGTVRDIVLGIREFDIDIAVEGNGIEFGKILQNEFGGELRTYSKFGTASLTIRAGLNKYRFKRDYLIDIATCREEYYPEAAKLPELISSCNVSLQNDMKRRDFTINAMALNLETNELIDPFGGKKDLDEKLIRILHPNSFVDDPTRILRAVRFAGRLGFRLEVETEKLAKKAIKTGLIKKLTPNRIRNELILILKEPNRQKILELMDELGIMNQLELRLPPTYLFRNIDKLLNSKTFSLTNYSWFVYLLSIIDIENPPQLLGLTRKELQKVTHTHTIISDIGKLSASNKPSEIYELLKNAGNEELLFIASAYPELEHKILNFVTVYKKIKLSISGKDLLKLGIPPGPLYKELLNATLHNKLNGNIHTKNEEINFLQNLVDKSARDTII